ncbi:MAG TPA: hypothetical protein VNO79_06890 [Actinomycetota bacterium]|nr:hypothetical protein [Actinomycetota bacterium]
MDYRELVPHIGGQVRVEIEGMVSGVLLDEISGDEIRLWGPGWEIHLPAAAVKGVELLAPPER